jgi:Fe(3+) dicitrate transport protein
VISPADTARPGGTNDGEPAPGKPTPDKPESDKQEPLVLERITIVGKPEWIQAIPGSAAIITSQQLKQHQDSDIHRVLQSVTGVHIQEEDGFGLRPNIGMRGAGSERSSKINLMEDGVLIAPAPYSAPSAYYFPNVRRMSGVEVRKGSAQIQYGPNTTGGSLNLISTPVPATRSTSVETQFGSFGAHQLYGSAGDRFRQVGYLIEGLFSDHNGFKTLQNGGGTGYSIYDLSGKLLFRSSPNASLYQRVELKAGLNGQTSDETYLGLTRDDFDITPFARYAASQLDRMSTDHTQLMARHFVMLSEQADLTTTIYQNDFYRNWYKLQSVGGSGIGGIVNAPELYPEWMQVIRGDDTALDTALNEGDDPNESADPHENTAPYTPLSVRSNQRNYLSRGVETRFNIRTTTGDIQHQTEVGARYHYDEEDRFQHEDEYRMDNGTMIVQEEGAPGSQSNRIGSARALALHIKHEIRWQNWILTPGVRFEQIHFQNRNFGIADPDRTGSDLQTRTYTVTEWIPGIGVSYSASNNLTLFSGVHKGFSPPGPASSPETRSERSVNVEGGMRLQSDPGGMQMRLEAVGFTNFYHNLLGSDLQAVGGEGTSARFNAGKARILGLETTASLEPTLTIAGEPITIPVQINYTLTQATFQSSFDSEFSAWGDVTAGDAIPFIPTHQLYGSTALLYKSWNLRLRVTASPGLRTIAGRGAPAIHEKTDDLFVTDLSSGLEFRQGFSLFVNVRNLFNATYIVSDRPAGVRPGLPRSVLAGFRWSLP